MRSSRGAILVAVIVASLIALACISNLLVDWL
jgi:hypothetical protein